jgi:hypothetical protein
MVIVKIESEMMAQQLIPAGGIFEQTLLKVAREVRPKLKRGTPHQMFKT